MTTQTHKYIPTADTTLRAEYGGDAIQNNGDSREVYATDLLIRHIFRELGWPADGVEQLCEIGNATAGKHLKVSDDLYPAISPYLTATQLSGVVSSAPAGYSATSETASFLPSLGKYNIYVDGDSIEAGTPGTTANNFTDTYFYQGMELTSGWENTHKYISLALGSSSFDNTNGIYTGYPLQRSTAFNQRNRTLPLNGDAKVMWVIGFGTNDLAYDGNVDGEVLIERFAEYCAKLREEFPNIVIIATTVFKRSGNNNNDKGYNDLLRAHHQSCGADLLLDLDNVLGDLASEYYVGDNIHITTAGHALAAPASRDTRQEAEALLDAGHTFADVAPAFMVNPEVSGTLTEGENLSVTDGVYSGIPRSSITVTYQWKDSSGANISGATSSTYTLQDTDVDTSSPTCVVTVTNSAGSVSYETSDLGAVTEASSFDPLTLSPDLYLDAYDGDTLWADAAGTTPATTTARRIDDKSTNGYVFTTSGDMTVNNGLEQDGSAGNDLVGDGVVFDETDNNTTATYTIFYCTDAADTEAGYFCGCNDSVNGHGIYFTDTPTMAIADKTSISSVDAITRPDGLHIGMAEYNADSLALAIDGVLGGTNAHDYTWAPPNDNLIIGNRPAGSSSGTRLIQTFKGLIIFNRADLTTTEKNNIGNFMASRYGGTWTGLS